MSSKDAGHWKILHLFSDPKNTELVQNGDEQTKSECETAPRSEQSAVCQVSK